MGLTGLPALGADTWGAQGISASLASDVPRLKAALAPSTPQTTLGAEPLTALRHWGNNEKWRA